MSAHPKVAIPRFTAKEVKIAAKQGWGIFNTGNDGKVNLEIQRIDESHTFPDDGNAIYFVLRNASKNKVCRDAIKIVYQI